MINLEISLEKTEQKSALFQQVFLVIMVMSMECFMPIVWGISFLEREPKKFFCFKYNKWFPCDKKEICRDNLTYMPDK